MNAVGARGLISSTSDSGGDAFSRDDARYEPHNLFVNTAKLVDGREGHGGRAALHAGCSPYDDAAPPAGKHVSQRLGRVLRTPSTPTGGGQGGQVASACSTARPMTLEHGAPITADNVVIQQVEVTESDLRRRARATPRPR